MPAPLYMDYQATTPLDPRVLEAMMPYFQQKFGNPHSSAHRYGWEAEAGLERARGQVAGLIGAKPEEIIFTSGATEANNLALKGVMQAYHGRKNHLITVQTEHKCVIEAARHLQRSGCHVDFLPVSGDGLVRLDDLKAAIGPETALVSVMAVNNEIGIVQPLDEIARICADAGALFHTDAAQAAGKIPLDVAATPVALMSLSAHKMYGPKGIGALYVRKRTPLTPQMHGGGQERGIRSGTVAAPLCVGFGQACAIAVQDGPQEAERIAGLMMLFKKQLSAALPGLHINGHEVQRWQGNLNLSFPGLDGDRLLAALRGLAVSSGAACASAVEGPSYVLQALGLSEAETRSAIRFGIGRFTTEREIVQAADLIADAVVSLGGLKVAALAR